MLHILEGGTQPEPGDDANPFVRYGPRLAWWAFARVNGMTAAACEALTYEVAGDFVITPFERSTVLSDELTLDLWVKDETGNIAGSHKARHLVAILLHLRAAETLGLLHRAASAGDRLVWQRRARSGHAGGAGRVAARCLRADLDG